MKSNFMRVTSRFLIASMTAMSITTAHAGMIGAEQASILSASSDRAALINLVNRADVAHELQVRGVDPQAASERVASMTDAEVRALKGQVDTLPAGAFGPDPVLVTLGIVAVIVGLWALLTWLFK